MFSQMPHSVIQSNAGAQYVNDDAIQCAAQKNLPGWDGYATRSLYISGMVSGFWRFRADSHSSDSFSV